MRLFSNTKEIGLEDVLERIEKERFSSLNDPGIHGILTRLNGLEFIRTSFASCSGHPKIRDGSTYGEEGYVFLAYNPYDPRSKEFHNSLRDISIEHNGYQVSFSRRFVDTTKVYKIEKYDELIKTGFEITDSIGADFRIQINPNEQQDAEEITAALSKFWQKVSDLIKEYESKPIDEVLKPYYFGLRSSYGKIEATHPAFDKYQFSKQANGRGKLFEELKSEVDKELHNSSKISKSLVASILLSIVTGSLGFGTGYWYGS